MKKKNVKTNLKADVSGMLTVRGIAIVLIIIVVSSLLFVSLWMKPTDVCKSCHDGDIVFLTGRLRGFSENQTDNKMDVVIGNASYKFDIFHESYMQKLVGFNITVKCCFRTDQSNQIQFYDYMSAVINEES